jgi:hypothetical protein
VRRGPYRANLRPVGLCLLACRTAPDLEKEAAWCEGLTGKGISLLDQFMTGEQLASILKLAEAGKGDDGWSTLGQYTLTLHTAFNGASLSLSRIEEVKLNAPLIYARGARGETHVVRLDDVFAGTIEASKEKGRKAGFV